MLTPNWALRSVHFLYVAFITIAAWVGKCKRTPPKPLKALRPKIPKHLCLNLVANNDMLVKDTTAAFLQCLQSVAAWCRELGIETLTAYDRDGVLYGCSENVYQGLSAMNKTMEDDYESEGDQPLPPLSKSSGSSSSSRQHPAELNVVKIVHPSHLRKRENVAMRRQPKNVSSDSNKLTLHIASRASGKPSIASASRSLFQDYESSMSAETISGYNLSVSKLAAVLEDGLPPPDFMIIHHIGGIKATCPPMEFHGFPPWQISLTEFHRTHPDDISPMGMPVLISEIAFCRALDEYAGAEFRLGR